MFSQLSIKELFILLTAGLVIGLVLGSGITSMIVESDKSSPPAQVDDQLDAVRNQLQLAQVKIKKLEQKLEEKERESVVVPALQFRDETEVVKEAAESISASETNASESSSNQTSIEPEVAKVSGKAHKEMGAAINSKPLKKGDWVLNVSSETSLEFAAERKKELMDNGIHSMISKVMISDKDWYRVQIKGLETYASANALLNSIEEKLKLQGMWVGKDTSG